MQSKDASPGTALQNVADGPRACILYVEPVFNQLKERFRENSGEKEG